jgi:hypothetical protein
MHQQGSLLDDVRRQFIVVIGCPAERCASKHAFRLDSCNPGLKRQGAKPKKPVPGAKIDI